MDMETFKQSLYKLGQLGYFKVTDNPDFKVNPEKKTVDITVKGIEEGKNDVQFGGGYSEGGGFFVQAQFATRNFLGEGENLGSNTLKAAGRRLVVLLLVLRIHHRDLEEHRTLRRFRRRRGQAGPGGDARACRTRPPRPSAAADRSSAP